MSLPAVSQGHEPTCDGLDDMIASSSELACTRNAFCDTAHCTLTRAAETTLTVTLLSCRTSPGVRVLFRGGIYFTKDEILDDSAESLYVGARSMLAVIVEQLRGQNAIGFAVRLHEVRSGYILSEWSLMVTTMHGVYISFPMIHSGFLVPAQY